MKMKKPYHLSLLILMLGCCLAIASPALAERSLPTGSKQTRTIGIDEATEIIQQLVDGKVLGIKPNNDGYRAKVMHNGRIRIVQISKQGKLIRPTQSDR